MNLFYIALSLQNNETSELENKPENKNMCKRGCGFYGSVRFKDMCSKCYQEHIKCSSTLEQATLVHSTSIDMPDNRKSQLLDCCEHSPKDSTSNQSDPTTSSQLSRALKRKANPSVSAETSKGMVFKICYGPIICFFTLFTCDLDLMTAALMHSIFVFYIMIFKTTSYFFCESFLL